MNIIEPKVELLQQGDDITSHVARCARVCYDKETGNDEKLYNSLLKKGHLSVFRHASHYAIIPASMNDYMSDMEDLYKECPYIDIRFDKGTNSWYVATNSNFMIEDERTIFYVIMACKVSPEEFANTEVGHSMMRYTFKVTTQISTSRELNRKSPNSITELSTRYVDLKNGAICRPHWLSKGSEYSVKSVLETEEEMMIQCYLSSCEKAFDCYNALVQLGMKREDARGVLPLDTATKVIYTYSIEEWRHIIELRSDKRAHPNCQIIANMIKKELGELGYDFE